MAKIMGGLIRTQFICICMYVYVEYMYVYVDMVHTWQKYWVDLFGRNMYVYIYMHVCICICNCMYVCLYKAGGWLVQKLPSTVYTYVYVYLYVCVYIHILIYVCIFM
jgi:hypothetical protein